MVLTAVVVTLGLAGCGSEGEPAAPVEAVVTPVETTTTLAPADHLAVAAREWRTLLATTMSDPLRLPEPVFGPTEVPLSLSASGSAARIWNFVDGSWGVAHTVGLTDQVVLPAGESMPAVASEDVVITDGTGSGLRFILPTAYGNGPAVAAVGFDGSTWSLLTFTDSSGGWPYATDAGIEDGRIVVWHNDCTPSCADGITTPLGVQRVDTGYQIDPPPPPPTTTTTAPPPPPPTTAARAARPDPGDPCRPGSSPDCADQHGDGDYRYIVGWAECVDMLDGETWGCVDLDEDGFAGYPDSL